MDMYGFYTGKIFDAYDYLGAHLENGGCVFRIFAPGAEKAEVIGDFGTYEMNRIYDGNFYECHIDGARKGMKYLYRIYSHGQYTDHCDIYVFGMELRPDYRSIICDISEYRFTDDKWMRSRTDCRNKPLNIYEMHLGSWKRKPDGSFYTYDEITPMIADYVTESGYNYIEFLPLCEHPCDESWGYQNTGFFSPTSRYGSAAQLKRMIDILHSRGIGVIMDFVPVHFANDSYGLRCFDGTALYEYPHTDVGLSEWGSCNFNHSRGEVRSFLQSCAFYWLKEFHVDGLRMDAISRIIYWQGDERRGVNSNGTEFLRYMNSGLKKHFAGCILIAEDSTDYRGTTQSVENGGLGFDYKWDMGYMNDTLNYFRTAPEYRYENYNKLTFSMMYFYNERYMLPFSHDENVHGKATILQKMSGDYDDKFPQARTLYLYMYTHPGKKLVFMGSEFGQLREWDEKRGQDFEILSYPIHSGFYEYIKELNHLYLTHKALYENDYSPDSFKWLECSANPGCIYAAARRGGSETLAVVFNMSDTEQEFDFSFDGEILINTDWDIYGGGLQKNTNLKKGSMILPRYSGMLVKTNGLF